MGPWWPWVSLLNLNSPAMGLWSPSGMTGANGDSNYPHRKRGKELVRADELEGAWVTARELNGFSWWVLQPCSSESIAPILCWVPVQEKAWKGAGGEGGTQWDLHSPGNGPEQVQWNTSMGTQKNDVRCGPGRRSHLWEFPPEVMDSFLGCSFHDNRASDFHTGLMKLGQDIQADCGEEWVAGPWLTCGSPI